MNVLVCGGREYNDAQTFGRVMYEQVLAKYQSPHIIAGGARGADTLARDWAKSWRLEYTEYPADWERYGKRAGMIRNKQMLGDGQPDLVVAFPGGVGTAMMIRIAREAGVPVFEVT